MSTVMVVDDAMFMRASIKNTLTKNGHKVVAEAENGKEAILKYQIVKPEFVTLDITIPEMDGIMTLKELKKLDASVKVIMCTAIGQESKVREAILSGAKGFIVKPFKEENLINTIEKLSN